MSQKIQSYAEFFLFYLSEHSKPSTRLFHYVGTLFALGCIVMFMFSLSWGYLLLGLIVAYGFAWFSHFFIEHNQPATFTYPLWSYIADHHMLALAVFGQLTPQLDLALQRYPNNS